jgi:ketosteroid isomerase-like protein
MKYKLFIFLIILSACINPDKDKTLMEQALIKTDLEFSKLNTEKGRNQAFIYYAADSVIMLRQGNFPLLGKRALYEQLKAMPDNKIHLLWTPVKAEVSGDLGYTFGNWELRLTGKDTVMYGNYVTIWKRCSDGKWKYVLDGGNDTPKPK